MLFKFLSRQETGNQQGMQCSFWGFATSTFSAAVELTDACVTQGHSVTQHAWSRVMKYGNALRSVQANSKGTSKTPT
jgi:hypothetical protein